MSSVQHLREFVKERLTAAAEEIFGVFEKTFAEYEEMIGRQCRLLDIVLKPEIKLHRIELPQHHVCKEEEEEAVADQHLCKLERNSSLDQEPPQIKEEQEELCTSQEGEQLVLKQETGAFTSDPAYEQGDGGAPEPNSDHRLLSHNEDQEGSGHVDPGSPRKSEPKPKRRSQKNKRHDKDVNSPETSKSHCTHMGKKCFKCDTCEKCFRFKSRMKIHLRAHTGEKPYSCKLCGKSYSQIGNLNKHVRIHTELCNQERNSGLDQEDPEAPQISANNKRGKKCLKCDTCGKSFRYISKLNIHLRTHTGERPYLCTVCGKGFKDSRVLVMHVRNHTGEKPYQCNTCGKRFCDRFILKRHMIMHSGEKPYHCSACGKAFRYTAQLRKHILTHTGGKPQHKSQKKQC